MRVVKQRENGIVRRVVLLDDRGNEVAPVNRFLSHLTDSDYSPNTVCACAYDLRHLVQFFDQQGLGWNDFRPSSALEFLACLRRVPSRRPAQRLGLTVATERGRLLSAATVQRVLAATSSFFEWAIASFLLMLDGGLRPGEVLCLGSPDEFGGAAAALWQRGGQRSGGRAGPGLTGPPGTLFNTA